MLCAHGTSFPCCCMCRPGLFCWHALLVANKIADPIKQQQKSLSESFVFVLSHCMERTKNKRIACFVIGDFSIKICLLMNTQVPGRILASVSSTVTCLIQFQTTQFLSNCLHHLLIVCCSVSRTMDLSNVIVPAGSIKAALKAIIGDV